MQDPNAPLSSSPPAGVVQPETFQKLTAIDAEANLGRPALEGPWAALRVIPWLLTLASGAAALYFVAYEVQTELVDNRLLAAMANPSGDPVVAGLTGAMPTGGSAAHFETLAEYALGQTPPNLARAREAALRAVDIDPGRPFVWAILAYVEQQQAGRVTATVVENIRRSMDLCPLCDEELVRWRFNFVLANWAGMPEDVRRRSFDQADILRWEGANAEFLAEMRIKAEAAGIPYTQYRAGVVSPVPSLDRGVAAPGIGPAPAPPVLAPSQAAPAASAPSDAAAPAPATPAPATPDPVP